MKAIIDKLDLIKIKNYSVKDNVKRKRQATDGKKIFAKYTYDVMGILSKLLKNIKKLNNKKTNNLKNGSKTLEISPKKWQIIT